jgi:hypothetical protein
MSAGKHSRMWGRRAADRDLAVPDKATPKHRAGELHDWEVVAEFTGLRAALLQCRLCGETRTVWRTDEMDAAR